MRAFDWNFRFEVVPTLKAYPARPIASTAYRAGLSVDTASSNRYRRAVIDIISTRISHYDISGPPGRAIPEGCPVRNKEVVGSIPISSTKIQKERPNTILKAGFPRKSIWAITPLYTGPYCLSNTTTL